MHHIHVGKIFFVLILVLYGPATMWLFLYGINNYYMVFLFLRKNKKELLQNSEYLEKFWSTHGQDSLPKVTTQLPIYNERNVIERLIHAVVNIDYPQVLHEVQILDDSQDETKTIVDSLVNTYKSKGFNIKCIRRNDRSGFKAGALNSGLEVAEGEFLAIFDADFIPGKDFFYKMIPFFYEKEKVALIQARWGHVNGDYSLLSKAQSIGIDGHFVIEQGARTWNGLYMNFNGTAGMWRKEAIFDAGGWHADTLTEDLDLSYRAQLKGWKTKYLINVVAPSELPVDINAYKSQQHRWAKGSIQTAIKILPRLFNTHDTLIKKIEATMHLTQYMVHPMMCILAVLSLPLILLLKSVTIPTSVPMMVFFFLMFLGVLAPSFLYIISQKIAYKDWWKRCLFIPVLMFLGCGIAINNTKAVIEALLRIKSDFLRTPKYGVVKQGRNKMAKDYTLPLKSTFVVEILLSVYCCVGFMQYTSDKRFIFGPFLLIYAIGFFYVGMLSFLQAFRKYIKC